ncbi:hypothetical protein ASPACDRAFT_46104 [Aspergillus aculeatus ATCC 16872]|uniref:Ketoreductase (KR) domain-containing protein n=1 Tax=Aspergillus aculeatus (strain ATCC 16872 / CBS 172.66 / WB 5094) TaxID=690307 RepID=A0A1L9WMC4_ASPA1|nr:uncharacterized protein ASPACDRAFT_46104 [Aspergillus aculeatus ATCC 16872]OJJ97250.1 hypothetical protein ASPACDRAFT_46104 [Aspergillus aculeatus ATCC 16872]
MDQFRPLLEPPFLMLSAGCALFYLGMYLPFNYIIVQAEYEGMSAGLAGYLIPILNGATLFGRILPGKAADNIGRLNTMIAMCAFAGVIVLALWLPGTGNAPIMVFFALYGGFREIGVRSGTLWLIVAIAALVASPIGGALEGRDGGAFVGLQVFAGLAMLIGTGLFVVGRWALAGWDPFAKVLYWSISVVIDRMAFAQWQNCLKPKVHGASNLDLATCTSGYQLDYLVCFSWVSSIFGGQGLANYAAVDCDPDGLMRYRRQSGLAGSAIDVGMVVGSRLVTQDAALQQTMERLGFDPVTKQECLD